MGLYSLEKRLSSLEHILLNESKQVGTIYHACSLADYMEYILPKDTLSASGLYRVVTQNNETDWIFFTRNRRYTFDKKRAPVIVRLVVDGDKLSNNYKIRTYNAMAAQTIELSREYGIDFSTLDADDLEDLGFYDMSPDDFKDSPSDREDIEIVKGPIKRVSKYVTQTQFDIAYINNKIINDAIKHTEELSHLTYMPFIDQSQRDPQLYAYLKQNVSDGDSLKTVLDALASYKTESLSDKFIRLCKENNLAPKVSKYNNEIVVGIPAHDFGYNSTDSIYVIYEPDNDVVEILSEIVKLDLNNIKDAKEFYYKITHAL